MNDELSLNDGSAAAETRPSQLSSVPRRLLPWAAHPAVPLCVFLVLACTSMARKSATYDEPLLLASGARYLRTFDTSVNAENPPLLKAVYALPTLFSSHFRNAIEADPSLSFSYSMAAEFEYGNGVLFTHPRHRIVLFACRCVAVCLAAVLGVVLYLFCRARWSAATAAIVLWVYALSPNILANAQLITPDMGCTAFVFLCVLSLFQLLRTVRWRWAVCFGLALGAALLTKFTAVLLLPCIVAQTLAFVGLRRGWRQAPRHALQLVVGGMIALLLIALLYGFRGLGTTLAAGSYLSPLVRQIQGLPLLPHLPMPVPEAYVRGFDIVAFNNQPGLPNIFLGRLYPEGGRWWYYYAVVLAVKVPIALLGAVVTGLVLTLRRRGRNWADIAFFTVVPAVFLFNFSFIAYRQLGLRYILPVWPFLLLAVAAAVNAWFLRRGPGESGARAEEDRPAPAPTWIHRLPYLGAAWYVAASFLIYPHYLSYFNEWTGGASRGWRILAASNTDWGQDLPALAAWQRRHGDPRMFVLYCGSAPPPAYGVHVHPWGTLPPPPYLAVSVTNLYLCMDIPLVRYLKTEGKPVGRAGYSILIYALDETTLQGILRQQTGESGGT